MGLLVFEFSYSFTQCFERLLLCDLSSYAIQLIAGTNKFPGPTVRLLGSAITVCIQLLNSLKSVKSRFLVLNAKLIEFKE